jgi:hypothetical protein
MAVKKCSRSLSAVTVLWSQAPQTTAVRAGRTFDQMSGQMLTNQVVLIQGERIMAAGFAAGVSIPPGAKVIDLSRATVAPRAHLRLFRYSMICQRVNAQMRAYPFSAIHSSAPRTTCPARHRGPPVLQEAKLFPCLRRSIRDSPRTRG